MKEKAQKSARLFIDSMPIQGLDLTAQEAGEDVGMQEQTGVSGPPQFKLDINERTLYLKSVPVFVSRKDLI